MDGALLDAEPDGDGLNLVDDLVSLLSAARVARDEFLHEGARVGRDALAPGCAAMARRSETPASPNFSRPENRNPV